MTILTRHERERLVIYLYNQGKTKSKQINDIYNKMYTKPNSRWSNYRYLEQEQELKKDLNNQQKQEPFSYISDESYTTTLILEESK